MRRITYLATEQMKKMLHFAPSAKLNNKNMRVQVIQYFPFEEIGSIAGWLA
jgi:hypothetical protein